MELAIGRPIGTVTAPAATDWIWYQVLNVVFSMLYNGKGTSGARGVQQNLGNLLASYKR